MTEKMKNLSRVPALLIAAVLTVLMTASCKTQFEVMMESNDVPAKYQMAFDLFDAGKYAKSASMFESLKIAVDGTAQEDTVEYYTAYSHYCYGDMIAAEQAFDSFINVFPRSPFTDKARFMYLDCLYQATYRYELDQTPTYKALGAINEYLIDFPDNDYIPQCQAMIEDLEERLDRKDYEAAKLYYTIEDYKAAHYALKLVLKEDAANLYREDIMYYTALSAYKYAQNSVPEKQRERYMTFTDDYFSFVSEFPESVYRKELDGRSLFEKAAPAATGAERAGEERTDRSCLSVEQIYRFASEVPLERLKPVLARQAEYNMAIAEEGLRNPYGANIGKVLLKRADATGDVRLKARAVHSGGVLMRTYGESGGEIIEPPFCGKRGGMI